MSPRSNRLTFVTIVLTLITITLRLIQIGMLQGVVDLSWVVKIETPFAPTSTPSPTATATFEEIFGGNNAATPTTTPSPTLTPTAKPSPTIDYPGILGKPTPTPGLSSCRDPIVGTTTANTTVLIYVDNILIGDITSNPEGWYGFSFGDSSSTGIHRVEVRLTDATVIKIINCTF